MASMTQMPLWCADIALSCERSPGLGLPSEAPIQQSAESLGAWLGRWFHRPVSVIFTENSATMLSFREDGGGVRLRIHRMFAKASEEVLWALAVYLRDGDRDAGTIVDAFIETHGPDYVRPVSLQPQGRFFHLQQIFDDLNQTYFHRACRARITWGKASSRRYRRSIQLGCYIDTDRLIRIHPCLDQAFVPRYYVAWVTFHEMLHEIFGVGTHGKKRRNLHPPEFLAIEESYPDYRLCKQWEAKNLYRLLKY